MSRMRNLFRFPNPVNETSARLVAAGVALQSVAFVVFGQWWQLVPLAYGFVARVASGPTFSPLGQLVTRVITPSLSTSRFANSRFAGTHRLVPGPPKRFAQGIGAALSVGALIAWGFGAPTLAIVLVAGITVAATLESVFAFCLGCVVFNRLMTWGVVPDSVCAACNDISLRWPGAGSPASPLPTAGRVSGSVSGPAMR